MYTTIRTPGGHSSVPPEHTASECLAFGSSDTSTDLPIPVGYLADILVHFESNPFPLSLTPEEPYLKYLSCLAEYAPDIPRSIKKAVGDSRQWDTLAKKLAKESPLARAFMGTTQVRRRGISGRQSLSLRLNLVCRR